MPVATPRSNPGVAPPPGAAATAEPSFEQALAELETIVKSLETGSSTLAQAIGDYERGARLRQICEQKLAEAEARVQAILQNPSGLSLRDVE